MVAVISMLVDDEPGVMQRVMGEFTRKRINVETIVVGKCEKPDKARIVLSVTDPVKAQAVIEHLRMLQEVNEAETVDESRHESYLLMMNDFGKARMTGSIEELSNVIEKSQPKKYISTVSAL
ncbi:MAG: acetolactate synthase [Thermoplasmata archaeon]|nr:acetolactate synthase [Thermoplasmata archaeon]